MPNIVAVCSALLQFRELRCKEYTQGLFSLQEYPEGIPGFLCSNLHAQLAGSNSSDLDLFPHPRSLASDGQPRDIAFSMVEGDFAVCSPPLSPSLLHKETMPD